MSDTKLTKEQLETWREALSLVPSIGYMAFFIPDWAVERLRNIIQSRFDSIENARKSTQSVPAVCTCDPKMNGTTTHKDGRVTCNKCKLPRQGVE